MPRARLRLATAVLAAAAAACAGPFPQSTLAPKSDYAGAIDHLFSDIVWWALLVFIVVEGVLLFTVVRFRQREGAPPPRHVHGHTALEIAWTLAPALILLFIAVPTMRTIFATAGEAPSGALAVEVIGHQWWWEYRYPELHIVTANEMHIPVHRPVRVSITSADVIHSFWAPALGGKRDAIPGQTNYIAFRGDSVGEYDGQCAEFCGASHANMRLRVVIDSDSGFAAWAARQQGGAAPLAKGTLAARGLAVFQRSACIGCHTMQGVSKGIIGPDLTHVGSRSTIAAGTYPNDSLHLARWIADAPSQKPGALMMRMAPPLTDADVAALIAYLRSMK